MFIRMIILSYFIQSNATAAYLRGLQIDTQGQFILLNEIFKFATPSASPSMMYRQPVPSPPSEPYAPPPPHLGPFWPTQTPTQSPIAPSFQTPKYTFTVSPSFTSYAQPTTTPSIP
jgi:hypothetical protein